MSCTSITLSRGIRRLEIPQQSTETSRISKIAVQCPGSNPAFRKSNHAPTRRRASRPPPLLSLKRPCSRAARCARTGEVSWLRARVRPRTRATAPSSRCNTKAAGTRTTLHPSRARARSRRASAAAREQCHRPRRELHGRRSAIGDEAPDNHLPPKPNPELPAAQVNPERRLRRSERRAHVSGVLNDDRVMPTWTMAYTGSMLEGPPDVSKLGW
jgi:hypothetical protein